MPVIAKPVTRSSYRKLFLDLTFSQVEAQIEGVHGRSRLPIDAFPKVYTPRNFNINPLDAAHLAFIFRPTLPQWPQKHRDPSTTAYRA